MRKMLRKQDFAMFSKVLPVFVGRLGNSAHVAGAKLYESDQYFGLKGG